MFKALLGIVGGVILLMIIFAIFPMILSGSDAVNNMTNATEYLGLVEINNLAPLLIYIGLIIAVVGFVVWMVFGRKIKRFFGR